MSEFCQRSGVTTETFRAPMQTAQDQAQERAQLLQESDRSSPGTPRTLSRWHSSVYVSEGQAAVELFFRLNHARQTMDYVRRQVSSLDEPAT